VTSAYNQPTQADLRAVLGPARCLLLDFDGPVCRLFAGHGADRVAAAMREWLARRGIPITDPDLVRGRDPHRLLRAAKAAAVRPELARELEELAAEEEEVAALSAQPTPGADEFIRTVAESGRQLAITTNNAPGAVRAYLKQNDLDGYFGEYVFGRNPDDPDRMKPDPECLVRAIAGFGVHPRDCLMIGDSVADASAAEAARVVFLGYARSLDRVARLRSGHPHPVVVGMAPLTAAARDLEPLKA